MTHDPSYYFFFAPQGGLIMSVPSRVWARGVFTACALALPAIAGAQLPNSFSTPGATTKANVKEICASGYEASVKPVASWQKTSALEKYWIRPASFTGELDHLVPVSLGGSN